MKQQKHTASREFAKKVSDNYDLSTQGRGTVRFFLFNKETGEVKKVVEKSNLILFSGADILAQLISGNPEFAVDAMYLEFQNLVSPSDPITPPAFDRTGGVAYYNGLSGSPNRDFLRVPLTVSPLITPANANYAGNQITFFGISEGTIGFEGKPFNPAVNSAVFGAALIATPDFGDQSQDVVFSRVYAGIDKILKEVGFEIGVTWTIRFN